MITYKISQHAWKDHTGRRLCCIIFQAWFLGQQNGLVVRSDSIANYKTDNDMLDLRNKLVYVYT